MKRFRTISIAVFLLSVLCNSAFAENADLSFPYDPKTVPDEYVPISTISERIRDNSARFVFWNEDRFGAYPRFLAGKSSGQDNRLLRGFCKGDVSCVDRKYLPIIEALWETSEWQSRISLENMKIWKGKMDEIFEMARPYGYIGKDDGEKGYAYLQGNMDLVMLKYDEWLSENLIGLSRGEIIAFRPSSQRYEIIRTFRDFVELVGFPELYGKRGSSETSEDRAVCSFQIYLLLTDKRYYQPE